MPLSILQFVDSENVTVNFSVDVEFFESPTIVVVDSEIDLTLSFFQPSDFRPCFFVDNTVELNTANGMSFEVDIVFGDKEIIVAADNHVFVEFELIDVIVANDWIDSVILDYEVIMQVDPSAWWPTDTELLISDENSWIEATSADDNSSAYWG